MARRRNDERAELTFRGKVRTARPRTLQPRSRLIAQSRSPAASIGLTLGDGSSCLVVTIMRRTKPHHDQALRVCFHRLRTNLRTCPVVQRTWIEREEAEPWDFLGL